MPAQESPKRSESGEAPHQRGIFIRFGINIRSTRDWEANNFGSSLPKKNFEE
jgi:hypothetical protein